MKTFLTVISIFISFFAVAQEEEKYNVSGSFSPWSEEREANAPALTFLTLVSDANLREKPNSEATVVQKIPIATKVTVTEFTKNMTTLNGFEAPWCKIKLENGKSGYLWAGTLSLASLTYEDDYSNNQGLSYLVGVGNFDKKSKKITLQVRAAKNGKEIAKTEFVTQGDLSYYITIRGKNTTMGFDKIKDVVEVNTHYDACGYPSGENLLFLQENKLQKVLSTSNVSDAGVFYSGENAILPQDKGGIANHIVLIKDSAGMDEKNGDMVVVNQEYSVAVYKWNGDKLLKTKELK
jgi:hypothetical protein